MASFLALSRLSAAASVLTGAVMMMTQSGPSWEGVRFGLLCLVLWAVFAAIARAGRRTGLRRARSNDPSAARLADPYIVSPTEGGPGKRAGARTTSPPAHDPASNPTPLSSRRERVPAHRERILRRLSS